MRGGGQQEGGGGGGGGDGQRRDFEREEGETGLRNPCISIPLSLYGSSRREGGRKKEWKVSKRGMEEVKKLIIEATFPFYLFNLIAFIVSLPTGW